MWLECQTYRVGRRRALRRRHHYRHLVGDALPRLILSFRFLGHWLLPAEHILAPCIADSVVLVADESVLPAENENNKETVTVWQVYFRNCFDPQKSRSKQRHLCHEWSAGKSAVWRDTSDHS